MPPRQERWSDEDIDSLAAALTQKIAASNGFVRQPICDERFRRLKWALGGLLALNAGILLSIVGMAFTVLTRGD